MNVRLFALSVLVFGAAGCGQPSADVPTAEPSTGDDAHIAVILGDSTCQLEGAMEVAAGPLTIGLVNETDSRFDLDLWRLNDGHQYDELATHVAEEMRRIQAGEEPLGHPDFAELVAEATADGASAELRTNVTAGTYGFACVSFATPAGPTALWAAGPLRAT